MLLLSESFNSHCFKEYEKIYDTLEELSNTDTDIKSLIKNFNINKELAEVYYHNMTLYTANTDLLKELKLSECADEVLHYNEWSSVRKIRERIGA